jgi:hypothetical protein
MCVSECVDVPRCLNGSDLWQVTALKELLQKRDREIAILVAKLKKERALRAEAGGPSPSASVPVTPALSTRPSVDAGAVPSSGEAVGTAFAPPASLSEAERQVAYDRFKATYPVGFPGSTKGIPKLLCPVARVQQQGG